MRRDIRVLSGPVSFARYADRHTIAPQGLFGGKPGTPGKFELNPDGNDPRPLRSKGLDTLQANDLIRLKLPGAGPRYIITPLCVFDFDPDTNAARLKSLNPGVTLEQVREQTGFEFLAPREPPVTQPPTEEELTILRTRIDRAGALRR